MTLVLVALGAAIGAPLRFVAGHLLDGRLPWGTVIVNVTGSFLLGLFSGAALSGEAMAFLGAGFCGGLTTYSAFAVQTLDNGSLRGPINVVLTIPPALAACALGYWITG